LSLGSRVDWIVMQLVRKRHYKWTKGNIVCLRPWQPARLDRGVRILRISLLWSQRHDYMTVPPHTQATHAHTLQNDWVTIQVPLSIPMQLHCGVNHEFAHESFMDCPFDLHKLNIHLQYWVHKETSLDFMGYFLCVLERYGNKFSMDPPGESCMGIQAGPILLLRWSSWRFEMSLACESQAVWVWIDSLYGPWMFLREGAHKFSRNRLVYFTGPLAHFQEG
jgi:hypothetical protein